MRPPRPLIVLVVVLLALRELLHRRSRDAGPDVVRYRIPAGQDPAAVMGALRVHSVSARQHMVDGEPVIAISLDAPGDRARIQGLRCAHERGGRSGPTESVTFLDELPVRTGDQRGTSPNT